MSNKSTGLRDCLINMLTTLDSQTILLAQVAADVAALKNVVSQLAPEVGAALSQEAKLASDKFQAVVASKRMLLEALKKGISEIPN
jgi:hypothetical protein